MRKPITIPTDRKLVGEILTEDVTLKHRFGDRYSQDILDALVELLYDYDNMQAEFDEIGEMERHIEKLETMLDRRKVRYKKWEE